MSVNKNYLISDAHINTMITLALEAHDQKNPEYLEAAIEPLNQYPLTQEQNNKIVAILQNVSFNNAARASLLITQVLNGSNTASVQPLLGHAELASKAPMDDVCFTEVPSSEFANALYRNNLKNREFGKEALQNFDADLATIAQRQGASEHQNSEAKPTQPKTDSSGCFGINSIECLEKRCHLMTDKLLPDIIHLIFSQCLSTSDYESPSALACVNDHWYQCSKAFSKGLDLKQLSIPGLTILDAKAQGIVVDDEPTINQLAILKWYQRLASEVEGEEGLTLLTMRKGLTLDELVAMAAEKGINIAVRQDSLLHGLCDKPVLQTGVFLIANNVFKKTRGKCFAIQEKRLRENGCEIPTVEQYVALWFFTNTIFKRCLYRQDPLRYGRSSTQFGDFSLVVGASDPNRLDVTIRHFESKSVGAGGVRKF